jgi:hypothetical protein
VVLPTQESTNTIKNINQNIFLLMYISNPIVNDAEKDKNYYFNAPMYLRRKKNFFNDSGDVSGRGVGFSHGLGPWKYMREGGAIIMFKVLLEKCF